MKIKVTDIVYDTRDIWDGHRWDQNELELPSEMIGKVMMVLSFGRGWGGIGRRMLRMRLRLK